MSSALDQLRVAGARRRLAASSETEAAILEAELLLARLQLHELSVATIPAESGVSRATSHRHFASKDAVIAGLLARTMDQVFEAIGDFFQAEGVPDPPEVLRGALANAWRVWEDHRLVMRAVSDLRTGIACPNSRSSGCRSSIALRRPSLRRSMNFGPPVWRPQVPIVENSPPCCCGRERLMYVAASGNPGPLNSVEASLEPVTNLWLSAVYGGRR